jgi:hypothetical protein
MFIDETILGVRLNGPKLQSWMTPRMYFTLFLAPRERHKRSQHGTLAFTWQFRCSVASYFASGYDSVLVI